MTENEINTALKKIFSKEAMESRATRNIICYTSIDGAKKFNEAIKSSFDNLNSK